MPCLVLLLICILWYPSCLLKMLRLMDLPIMKGRSVSIRRVHELKSIELSWEPKAGRPVCIPRQLVDIQGSLFFSTGAISRPLLTITNILAQPSPVVMFGFRSLSSPSRILWSFPAHFFDKARYFQDRTVKSWPTHFMPYWPEGSGSKVGTLSSCTDSASVMPMYQIVASSNSIRF